MNPDVIHSLDSLRILSLDMISYAKSGHPGICLGAAPILYSIYANHLVANPKDPKWPNRDRFVMSPGHASALLYAILFMAGYDVSIDDLVKFRKFGSKTPGHPEYGTTPGVEVTTGVSGEGFANAVGMAMAEKYIQGQLDSILAKQQIIRYNVYCMVSDADLMEGVAHEAAALAGQLALENLIVIYDSNDVTSDGPLKYCDSTDYIKQFINYGWEVDFVQEGNDIREIDRAIERAKMNRKPTFIEIKTTIGRGSVNEGKNVVHGKPLSKEDMANIRKKYNINTNTLEITESAVKVLRKSISYRVDAIYRNWQANFENLKANSKEERLLNLLNFIEYGKLETTFDSNNFKIQNDYSEEIRESNSKIMNIISDRTKFFLGGSADLATSCHTALYKEVPYDKKSRIGRNIHFGVREHAMAAVMNGMALSKLRVYGSTFLSFADNMKPSIRLAAMMNLPLTYIFTHDSIAIGEDGPTHQPIEQLTMLRTIPNLTVLRPCDINEVIGCWDFIINNEAPVALSLSKSEAHILAGTDGSKVKQGAYVVKKENIKIDAVFVSTGIDFTKTYLITEELRAKGFDIRLVSMPSMELFFKQPIEYQREVIPPGTLVITIEAGSPDSWYKIASPGCAFGIDKFGSSGPKEEVEKQLEFDYETLLNKALDRLTNKTETLV